MLPISFESLSLTSLPSSKGRFFIQSMARRISGRDRR
jgi:hypothetical protein